MDLAKEFDRLFDGLRRIYGRYDLAPDARADARGKIEGRRPDGEPGGSTRHGEVTLDLWRSHLKGEHGLGIVPITDAATARFGAIDVDVYPVDLEAIRQQVLAAGLPLIVCRTKSGGAHLYLFLSAHAPAELVRSKLMEWAVALGYPTSEVFPKQTRLASERDEGSWINVPYHGGRRTTRYALGPDGKALMPEAFVRLADSSAVSEEGLRAIEAKLPPIGEKADDLFSEGPPCLQTLATRGFPEGTRNNGLFSVGVYLRKRFPDEWEAKLDEYNRELMDPPLGHGEVATIAKSLRKKNYSYRCKDQPISSCCNRTVCLLRDHGVGGAGDDPGVTFGELVKLQTEPPTWIWDVNGARLELTTEQLMDQRKFQAVVIERIDKWPNLIRPATWTKIVRERLETLKRVEVPVDATREGQLWVQLARFCTGRSVARSLDEITLGKPFTDSGRTYFCSSDFIQYLVQHRVNGVSEKELFRFLRKRGVEHHFKVLKGRGVNHWSVPAFEVQKEDYEVPRRPNGEAM